MRLVLVGVALVTSINLSKQNFSIATFTNTCWFENNLTTSEHFGLF